MVQPEYQAKYGLTVTIIYNNSVKKWLRDNDIEIYSTHSEGKSVVAWTLKTKIYKYMHAKDNTYIDFIKDVNDKNPKFKVRDHVRISKYKNIFAKGYAPNWSEEAFLIKKVKNTVPWTYVINDLNGEEIIWTF